MSEQHEHTWRIDYSQPVIDTNPQSVTIVCECGAVGNLSFGGQPEFLRMRSAEEMARKR